MYSLLLCCALLLVSANAQTYHETHRLQAHYSLPSGWANDPNGLIYAGGYYQLFYQLNPMTMVTGPVHWGHARSKDLIHWENLPIALRPDGTKQIFSGCAVFDKANATGLVSDLGIARDNQSDVLIAIYTLHSDQEETQAMSYSLDNGLTFTQYGGNPIIKNPGVQDFRDPNIFVRDGVSYMALAVHDRISFYSSNDLKDWTFLSSFGVNPNEGEKSGVWECPSLFSLKDEQGKSHDILIVSSNELEFNGSLTQYFVGNFNGSHFTSYRQSPLLWIENGFDNYAAVPYHNDPHGRLILIGWMSNWLYGQTIPTSIWRGQFTIPRELSLKTVNEKLHVAQRPVAELDAIVDKSKNWSLSKPIELDPKQTLNLTQQIPFKTGSLIKLEYTLDIGCAQNGYVGIQFGNDLGEFVSLSYDVTKKTYEFDRRKSGNVTFHKRFAERLASAERIATGNLLSGRIVLDVASIEIFADDGLNTFSALFFPTKLFENIQIISNIESTSKCVKIQSVHVGALLSIWK